ncbi:hypothetical protein PCASD_05796 [Puccinia coronata f. sp. avenae]|uniref:Uncharacterized protein n=1 Tax=Puccinia coronata f. sp. avenae TaxID=200324 RepID=A0A2N5SN61_9BASI|nr:hypothetical protein PCASD_18208 [Puccinia coronata f. sp. avenae]PLW43845.1 hypothetical protein PCASD_05796 [Puccinia coronata f. sp. avenae]
MPSSPVTIHKKQNSLVSQRLKGSHSVEFFTVCESRHPQLRTIHETCIPSLREYWLGLLVGTEKSRSRSLASQSTTLIRSASSYWLLDNTSSFVSALRQPPSNTNCNVTRLALN